MNHGDRAEIVSTVSADISFAAGDGSPTLPSGTGCPCRWNCTCGWRTACWTTGCGTGAGGCGGTGGGGSATNTTGRCCFLLFDQMPFRDSLHQQQESSSNATPPRARSCPESTNCRTFTEGMLSIFLTESRRIRHLVGSKFRENENIFRHLNQLVFPTDFLNFYTFNIVGSSASGTSRRSREPARPAAAGPWSGSAWRRRRWTCPARCGAWATRQNTEINLHFCLHIFKNNCPKNIDVCLDSAEISSKMIAEPFQAKCSKTDGKTTRHMGRSLPRKRRCASRAAVMHA